MSHPTPVTHSVDADNVGWIIFDDPAGRANVFNPATQAALRAAIDALANEPVKAVVLISGKEKIFFAGADLKWLGQLPDATAAARAAREGQALFARLDSFPAPVVCAIHGACAGGGFEMALACHWRIASDAKETVIGLPEVGIGLIPGWGGCARLPRLIGAPAAVDHILKAALVPAADARQTGLVDELVPVAELRTRAKAAALKLAVEGAPIRKQLEVADASFYANKRKIAAEKMRGQPAPHAALDAIERGTGKSLFDALAIEAELFGSVAAGEVAKNLVHGFFLRDAFKKASVDGWFSAPLAQPVKPIRTVGIIGSGVMGSGIAQWCAAHGIGVIMNDVDAETLKQGVTVIRELFADAVKRGKMTYEFAHRATGGIGITTDLQDLEDVDMVIEAIVENAETKRALFQKLAKVVRPDCILASNTSALPIEEITAGVEHPGRTIGVHFFNPVSRMSLVELVLSPPTTRDTAERALGFVRALGKSPVICKSAPGFYVTRALFFYLNAACQLLEQGVPTDAIDRAMCDWGWPMGPMRLIDEVGVDVTDFIFGELKHYYPARFERAAICGRLLEAGLKGRKNGTSSGFYSYQNGREIQNSAVVPYTPPVAKPMAATAIQDHLNGVLIAETKRVLDEGVLKTADEADFALLLGAGFPSFRGGLMRYAKQAGV